jgi:hypothetical protein
MEVTYTTTVGDCVALQRYFLRKVRAARVVDLLGWLLLPAIAVVAAVVLLIEDFWEAGLYAALSGLLYAVLYPLIGPLIFDRFAGMCVRQMGTRGAIGRTTLVLTDESFVEITETTRTEVRWEDIHGVDEAGDYTFIFVTGLLAVIVPRKGFCDAAEYEIVRKLVLSRVNQSTSKMLDRSRD